jgi:hypothetical protein
MEPRGYEGEESRLTKSLELLADWPTSLSMATEAEGGEKWEGGRGGGGGGGGEKDCDVVNL